MSRGERLDWAVGPFARAEWESGESVLGYVQWGRSFVDEEFDLADRLPVPVGDYVANWKSIGFSTSPSRPLAASVSAVLAGRLRRPAHRDTGGRLRWPRART